MMEEELLAQMRGVNGAIYKAGTENDPSSMSGAFEDEFDGFADKIFVNFFVHIQRQN